MRPTRAELRRVAEAPLTDAEIAEVWAGLLVAVHAVGATVTPGPAMRRMVVAVLDDPERVGGAVAEQVALAYKAVIMIGTALKLLRAVEPESVTWPPEVLPVEGTWVVGPERAQ